MLTTYFRGRAGQQILLKRASATAKVQSASFSSLHKPKMSEEETIACALPYQLQQKSNHDISQVDMFGRRFLWNQSLFNKLDQ